MVNLIQIDEGGHKVGRPILNRDEYFRIRNSAANKENFLKARSGDDNAKRKLVQFTYNDQLPDGILAGCCTAASTFAIDIDCHDREECLQLAQKILQLKEQLDLLELSASPKWGLHAVCLRLLGMTILENQIRFSLLTKTEMDCNAHDQQRVMFTGPADEETLLYLDDRIFDEPLSVEQGKEEYLRMKEREERGEEELPANYVKGEKHYRPWEQPCAGASVPQPSSAPDESSSQESAQAQAGTPLPLVFDHPVMDYINTMLPNGAPKGQRHNTMLKLASDLLILFDNNDVHTRETLKQLPWVADVVKERGERELIDVVESSKKRIKKREEESFYAVSPSKNMRRAIETVAGRKYSTLMAETRQQALGNRNALQQDDILTILDKFGKMIAMLFPYFPVFRLLCQNMKRKHYIAAILTGGAFMMTLMTRCWYRFWPSPSKKSRINSLLFLIGRSGSGKRFVVDFYEILMQPVALSDASQVSDLNKWNAEKEKNSGSAKNSSSRPTGIYRRLPPETSAAALREAQYNAHEVIDGEDTYLHVSIFDSELDNTLRQMKKGYMDQLFTLWLKSFHGEMHGSYLKTSSAPIGEYPVLLNCVYTGTEDAMRRLNIESNFVNGLDFRMTATPMGDTNYEMMTSHEHTQEDDLRDQQLRQWATNLDKTKGEIPCKAISDALREWTHRRMDDAKEEDSKALEDLVKRPCWHAINFALPFIVTRHWDQMVQDEEGYWKCGPGFATDKYDLKLALLLANAQLTFQKYFFLNVGETYYDNMEMKNASSTNHQMRSMLAFMRLPKVFTAQDVDEAFGYNANRNSINSKIQRLRKDGLIKKIRSGEDKGKYRKLP